MMAAAASAGKSAVRTSPRYAALVPHWWRFLEADEEERQLFPDAGATRAATGPPVAPPNRLREVRAVTAGERTWYLKRFQRTQLKNRLRFRLTLPRCGTDAEREALVTSALRARGVQAPRPVALGREGPTSYYLCAELPGEPLVALLRDGRATPSLLAEVARFCGTVLRLGVLLPDLSAEHVFVRRQDAHWRMALLDLHNGTLQSPGRVPRKVLRRVLRHFRRSVRGLPIPPAAALRFSVRLLRAAEAGDRARSILSELPTLHTAARYEVPGRSTRYAARNPARTRAELELLRRVWPGRRGDRLLDCPSGAGRLSALLAEELGCELVAGDGAFAMLAQARADGRLPACALQADSLQLPLCDDAVDGVVLFRFLHHLPPEQARTALAEACRVARRFVVVSFFHPASVHGLQRRIAERLSGRARTRHAVKLGALRRWMAQVGFALHGRAAELPYLRDFWVASFVRTAAPSPDSEGN